MNHSEPNEEAYIPVHWYVDAFGPLYPVIYAHRTVEAALPEARFAQDVVSLDAVDTVLDLCCGTGRHLVSLQTSGARLTGADYSSDLLRLARNQVSSQTALIRADMRHLPFPPTFDVLFSFFTSFGYFFEEADNVRTAGEIGRVLKPGGRFFMDYLNPPAVEATLVSESQRRAGQYRICERRWIDRKRSRVNKHVEIYKGNALVGKTGESVRLYNLQEMKAILGKAGLSVRRCWGDYLGGAYGETSPRMILSGVKGES